jgi:hypothetical protein
VEEGGSVGSRYRGGLKLGGGDGDHHAPFGEDGVGEGRSGGMTGKKQKRAAALPKKRPEIPHRAEARTWGRQMYHGGGCRGLSLCHGLFHGL